MPSHYEIYDRYPSEYDEMVFCEDYQNNLRRTLLTLFDWNEKDVLEPGIGTGRVTSQYISMVKSVYGLDRAEAMLKQAEKNLAAYSEKLKMQRCDNLDMDSIKGAFEIFIEGWAFGHTVSDHSDDIEGVVKRLVEPVFRLIKPNGHICFIETLGTNTVLPKAPNETLAAFYTILENKYAFKRVEVDTSYRFESNEEAQRIMGFFFGPDMAEKVKKSGKSIIPEWTGIWHRKR